MKKLILGAALATLLAAPAFSQSYDPGYGTGNSMAMPPSWHSETGITGSINPSQATLNRLSGIRAQAVPSATADSVFVNGQYVDADPDANIRFELQRDPPGRD
jgi:hypothetical protein